MNITSLNSVGDKMKSSIKAILSGLYMLYSQRRELAYFKKRERIRVESERQNHRRNIVRFSLVNNAYFEAYWKIYGIGYGPALILYIDGEEVLKFDFYGPGKGHYHVYTAHSDAYKYPALFMSENSRLAQIDRAIFEIENNLYWYLERYPSRASRKLRIRHSKLTEILADIKLTLVSYVERAEQTQQEISNSNTKE